MNALPKVIIPRIYLKGKQGEHNKEVGKSIMIKMKL